MLRLNPSAGTTPLFTGLAAAAALSGAAVLTVLHGSCDTPSSYLPHKGGMELIGGCVAREDLPIVPRPPKPLGATPVITP